MKRWSIYLFKVFGIRLELHATFILLVGWYLFMGFRDGGVEAATTRTVSLLIIFTTVVLHELGHCLVARRFDIKIPRIIILPIGGMAQFSRMPREPRQEFLITAAGPGVNFAIITILLLIPGYDPGFLLNTLDVRSHLDLLFIANLAMGLFNLLPVFPMDGGRLLRAAMAAKLPYLTSTRIAFELARVLAFCGMLFFLYHHHYLGVALLGFVFVAGRLEYHHVRDSEEIGDHTIGDVMRSHFLILPEDARISDAARFDPGFAPFDFIIVAPSGGPRGVITMQAVKLAVKEGFGDELLKAHLQSPAKNLQAEWPLKVYARGFRKQKTLHPVLYNDRIVGVLDTQAFREILKGRNQR
ncbi:MAG: hypothetical protein HOI65_06125 [Opitutae bacterium]|nr:hypothetical protein [Opitutae bacterium]